MLEGISIHLWINRGALEFYFNQLAEMIGLVKMYGEMLLY